MAWTLYELAKEENAGLQREIQKEVDAMLAQRGAGGELEANDLSAIPLLQGAIQETLRLYVHQTSFSLVSLPYSH